MCNITTHKPIFIESWVFACLTTFVHYCLREKEKWNLKKKKSYNVKQHRTQCTLRQCTIYTQCIYITMHLYDAQAQNISHITHTYHTFFTCTYASHMHHITCISHIIQHHTNLFAGRWKLFPYLLTEPFHTTLQQTAAVGWWWSCVCVGVCVCICVCLSVLFCWWGGGRQGGRWKRRCVWVCAFTWSKSPLPRTFIAHAHDISVGCVGCFVSARPFLWSLKMKQKKMKCEKKTEMIHNNCIHMNNYNTWTTL